MRTQFGRRLPRDEQGAVAILTAMLMVVLILCVALVVDLGNARDNRRQSQNAADAASLAGANMLYPADGLCQPDALGVRGAAPCITDAVAAVRSYATDNFQVNDSDWNTCTTTTGQSLTYVPSGAVVSPKGTTSCISMDSGTSPTKVRVYVPTRQVATFFGGLAGVSSIPVGSNAQAQLGDPTTCSLCILGNVNTNNSDFSVSGGSIAVNGNVSVGPQSYWTANAIGVVGTMSGGQPLGSTPWPPSPIPSFPDPLLNSLTLPLTTSGLPAKTDPCSSTATGGPGLYGAFSLPDSACTLQPGLYVISGTWDMKHNTVLSGAGVTLYAKSSQPFSAASSGYLDFKNGIVNIAKMTTGVTAGYAIIYDRNNTNPLDLQGNGGTSITGITYAPASTLVFNGGTDFGFSGGPIVVGGVGSVGNSSVTVSDPFNQIVGRKLLHLSSIP